MRRAMAMVASGLVGLGSIVACSSSPPLPPILVADGRTLAAHSGNGDSVPLVETTANVLLSQATWAPDGRLAVWTEVGTSGQSSIAMGNETGQRRIDGGTTPFFYAWSPDGSNVAYLGNAPDGDGVAMGIVDVAMGTARLVDMGAPYYLDWVPDGSRLAVHIDGAFVGYVDLEGNRIPLDIEPGLFQAPQVLDDGRLLIATAGDGGGVAMASEAEPPTVIAAVSGGTFFSASADGSRIAFTDSDEAPVLGALKVAETRGGEPEVVSRGPVVAFEWSPDGQRLLYLTVNDDGSALVPQVWEDGVSAAFEEFLPTREMISRYLPFWDQYSRVLTLWAPDGGSFVLPVNEGELNGILVYDVATLSSRRLTSGSFATWAPKEGGRS